MKDQLIAENRARQARVDAARAALPADQRCDSPRCDWAVADHIGGIGCVVAAPLKRADGGPLRLHDLPIFGAAWAADGREIGA